MFARLPIDDLSMKNRCLLHEDRSKVHTRALDWSFYDDIDTCRHYTKKYLDASNDHSKQCMIRL